MGHEDNVGHEDILVGLVAGQVVLGVIANPQASREDAARAYAVALDSSGSEAVDWRRVNNEIIARWEPQGFTWIQSHAWKLRSAPARSRFVASHRHASVGDPANTHS